MKIPGYIKVQLSLLTILAISSVSSTGLLIYKTIGNTSEENISIKSVNPLAVKEELQRSLTGSGITEALMNLNETLKSMVNKYSEEK
jgi:hypothetical protein